MTAAEKGKLRRWRKWLVAALALALCIAAGRWYLRSPRFNQYVRGRVVANLEAVTGGRVELRSLSWSLSRLQFDVRELTIHGKEGSGEAPYIHIDRLRAEAKITSLVRREIGLRALEIERPVIHLIVYPDGTTNQPSPIQGLQTQVGRLFDLSIAHLEIKNGELRVNDRSVPFDVSADGIAAGLSYDATARRYDGTLRAGGIEVRNGAWLPVQSALETAFSLWPATAEVKALRWRFGDSMVEAHGRISEFANPKLDLSYKATLDLAPLGRMARWPQLRRGVLQLNGAGTYQANDFATTGKLAVRQLEYRDGTVRVADANLGAEYSANRERLLLPHLFAQAWGGTVTGDAAIRHWTAVSPEQEGMAHLRAQNLPLPRLVAAITTPGMALMTDLHPAGSVGGRVNVHWSGAVQDAEVNIAAQIAAPATVQPGALPVSGHVEGEYGFRRRWLRVTALELATPATHLFGAGTMGRGDENLKLTLSTTNLGELSPAIDAVMGGRRLPVELRGRASFTGSVYGRVSAPTIAGRVQVSDFDTITPAAMREGAAAGGTLRAHWDAMTADVLYASHMVAARNGVLRRGGAQVNFDFSAALQQGNFTGDSPISGHAQLRDAEIAELQALAGYAYPVTGTVNANVALGGSRNQLRASGHLAASHLTAYGEPLTAATADVAFAEGEARFSNVNVVHNGARVTGGGAYNRATTAFRFDLKGSNLNLARIRGLQRPRLAVGGTMNFTARGSGTSAAPMLEGNVRVGGLLLNGANQGDFSVDAATSGAELRLSGGTSSGEPEVRLEGSVHLREGYPVAVTVDFARVDFNPLLRAYLHDRVSGRVAMTGRIAVRGPLLHRELLETTGTIEQLAAEIAGVKIGNSGPIRFRTGGQTFTLEQLRLVGEDTSVSASGSAQLTGARRLDLRSEGRMNLKLLQSYRPEFVSSGAVTFGVQVGGVLDDPQIDGQAQIVNGTLSYADLPNGLSEVNGGLVFNRDRLAVQSLTARTGGGTVSIGGFVTYGRTLVFNLTAAARDVRLRYPAGISSVANADLKVTGTLQNAGVVGEITVTKFGVNPQFDFAQYLARAKQPVEVAAPDSPLHNIHLDVHVVSTPELQVQTSLAKLSGDLDLRLRGTAARPSVLGRVNIVEGDVFLNGGKYHMERGDVNFTNPVRIEPVLDVEATVRVKEYEVTLGLHGPLDRLTTTYRSDPPLPTADIIALLALGHTREETAAQQQQVAQPSFGQAASYAILGQALNAAVNSRVQRIFGVSRIKIDPQASSETGVTSSAPQLSIEQQVNNNITLTYVTNLSQGNQQTIQLQYDVNRNLSIIAIRDDLTGVVSFDVKIRRRRK